MKRSLYDLGLAMPPLKQIPGTVVRTPTPTETTDELTALEFSTMNFGVFPNL